MIYCNQVAGLVTLLIPVLKVIHCNQGGGHQSRSSSQTAGTIIAMSARAITWVIRFSFTIE